MIDKNPAKYLGGVNTTLVNNSIIRESVFHIVNSKAPVLGLRYEHDFLVFVYVLL